MSKSWGARLFPGLSILLIVGCSSYHDSGKPKIKPPDEKARPQPATMSAETYLRKLSLQLRGLTPERQEYEALFSAQQAGQEAPFLQAKIAAYLASNEHADKMAYRLDELFELAPAPVNYYGPLSEAGGPQLNSYALHNSMNDLFREIAKRNLSWDTLLTGHQYTAHPSKNAINGDIMGDLLYFSKAAGTKPWSPDKTQVKFAAGDPRVAGALTTSRFFNRYGNTALNKNRRRAAAVFRAALCDDMKAVVVDEKGNQDEILDRVFPGAGAHGKQVQLSGLEGKHGADPACMKCHYKLDPMGLAFQSSGMILSPFASPGALVFKREGGGEVNIKGRGIGDVARAITEQPEYVNCQVQHFWRWFVGRDRFLERSTINELAAKFEEVGRKPNDFIAYLVSRPEFRANSDLGGTVQMVYQVKTVLQNCNGCHANEGIPSFTAWPIGGSESRHQAWLKRIRSALALDGGTRSMPPRSSVWQPDADQLEVIRQWFEHGSPNGQAEKAGVRHASK